MFIAKKIFQSISPRAFRFPIASNPFCTTKSTNGVSTEVSDEASKIIEQKYTPLLQQHQKVLFAISSENKIKYDREKIQQDKIFLAFFRKFQDVDVFEHSNKQDDLSQSTNSPRNCWYQIKIPFSSQIELRTRFQRHYSESLRVSKIMEVLDHIASKIAHDYCYKRPEVNISTICVDHMYFYKQMNSTKDLYISGYPTYQQDNQIEIQVDLMQPNDKGELVLTSCATFLLQAKDKSTGNPFQIPKLTLEGEENKERCQNLYNIGKENTLKRQYGNSRNNLVKPPETSEIEEIHHIFLQNETESKNKIKMESTLESKILLMQSQERNLDGQIYGGYLIKETIDLAWITAYNLVNSPQVHHKFPEICHLDDFQFLVPVEVSNIIIFESKVVYVYKNFVMIQVQCSKLDSLSSKELTNQSYTIFRVQGLQEAKQVFPLTYKESLLYLEAKRRFHKIIQ